MEEKKSIPKLTFKEAMKNYRRGQSDLLLTGFHPRGGFGNIDYSVYQGKPSINMINVPEKHQGQGIGKALIHELQRKYPKEEINWGMLTDQGAEFKKSLKFKKEPTEHAPMFQELQKQMALKEQLEKIGDSEIQKIKDENARMQAYEANSDQYNQVLSSISNLEEELQGKKPYKELVDIGEIRRKKKSSY